MADNAFPFPYFGAGEATYFEWAEVCVRFVEPPTEAAKAAILSRVPPPLVEDPDDPEWNGATLLVGSGQFAHLGIIDSYPADPGDEDELDDRFPFAAPSRVTRFNEDIEAWLRFAHEQTPILASYRHEDFESGGTELSQWHTWSLGQLDAVLAKFDPAQVEAARAALAEDPADRDDEDDDLTMYLLRGILEMASPEYQAYGDADDQDEEDDD